jgi:hypothetical protein
MFSFHRAKINIQKNIYQQRLSEFIARKQWQCIWALF